MPAKVQLTGGAFQDSKGNLLVNGYLKMKLSQDGSVTGVGSICSGIEIRIQLDSNGNVDTGSVQSVWGNDNILPVNTFYKITGYTAAGQPAWGPNNQQVTGTGTFDCGTWTPNQVINWVPPLTSVQLQTKGVNNTVQNLLNLDKGVMVDLTDLGNGTVLVDVLPEFDYGFTFGDGRPTSGQKLYRIVTGQLNKVFDNTNNVTFFVSGASPTANSTFTFDISFDTGVSWVPWLTITMHPTVPITFSVTVLATWVVGNGGLLRITAPNPQDATLSGVYIDVTGSQT